MHHAGEVVHSADMGDALLDGFAVVVYPFDEDISRDVVVAVAPAMIATAAALLDDMANVQRTSVDLEGESGLERGLGLGVEVDAELLEGGGVCELRVDARGGVFEEGELGEVALGAVEELVSPGALEGGDLGWGEETFEAVVEICMAC